MNKQRFGFIVLLGLLVVSAVLQKIGALALLGVRPNPTLALLIAAAFFLRHPFWYFGLVILQYALLKNAPYLDWPALALAALLLVNFWLVKILPWQALFSLFLLTAATTMAFFAMINFSFITRNPSLLTGEVLYNVVLGLVFYLILQKLKIEL